MDARPRWARPFAPARTGLAPGGSPCRVRVPTTPVPAPSARPAPPRAGPSILDLCPRFARYGRQRIQDRRAGAPRPGPADGAEGTVDRMHRGDRWPVPPPTEACGRTPLPGCPVGRDALWTAAAIRAAVRGTCVPRRGLSAPGRAPRRALPGARPGSPRGAARVARRAIGIRAHGRGARCPPAIGMPPQGAARVARHAAGDARLGPRCALPATRPGMPVSGRGARCPPRDRVPVPGLRRALPAARPGARAPSPPILDLSRSTSGNSPR
jgi:hypothetical protein